MPQTEINVIEDFAYNSDNSAYNRAYRNWRRHTQTPYMFRFRGNANERAYTEGRPMTRASAATVERMTLYLAAEMIGIALLICLASDLFCGTLLIWLLQRFGIDIRFDFLSFSMQGSQWAIAAARALRSLIKFGVPAAFLIRCFRLPHGVFLPARFGDLSERTAAIGFAMLTAAVFTLVGHGSGVSLAQQIFEYKDSAAVLSYALFDSLIAGTLAELMLRGAILQILRQFGDRFAILLTALIGFLLPNTIPLRIGELLIGLFAGYLLLRCGSLSKCVLMRALFTLLTYARLVLVYAAGMLPLWSFALLLVSVGTMALSYYVIQHRSTLRLGNRKSCLPLPQKLAAFAGTLTTLPWTAASMLLAVMQAFY